KYFRKAGVPQTGHEVSVRQVVYRVAHTIAAAGERMGYFDAETAKTYEDELSYLLIHQMGAFTSPVWFNLGLWHEHKITGSGANSQQHRRRPRNRAAPGALLGPQGLGFLHPVGQ